MHAEPAESITPVPVSREKPRPPVSFPTSVSVPRCEERFSPF